MLFKSGPMSEKTEEPTPRRLRKAREEGDAGVSAFAAQSVGFLVAVAAAPAAVGTLVERASADLRAAIEAAGHRGAVRFDAVELATTVVALALPLLVAAGVAAGVLHLVQSGGVVASKRLTPSLDRLNPIEGARRLFSGARLFSVLRAAVAGVAVGWLAYRGLADHVVDVARVRGPVSLGVVVGAVGGTLAWRAAFVGLALGLIDVLVTRSGWRRRLRMGKDEVKREHKESEGDPQLKAARERARHELLTQATIANVRGASVVVVNPTHLACALRYDEKGGDAAPVVVASGDGELARQIRAAAEAWGVPVVEDVPLAQALAALPIGDVIPEALYEAVAEVLRVVAGDEARRAPAPAPGTPAPG
jgi:type III secretion protein U